MKFKRGVCMLRDFFAEENIEVFGVIPFSACHLRRADIISRRGVAPEEVQSAVMFLIPYYVNDGAGNVSLYARAEDYHAYSDALFARLLPKLEAKFGGRFLGFADKSPIEENIAAAKAGLGKIGDHYMLIHETYGTFVFLAEILSTLPPEMLGFDGHVHDVETCSHCGACKKACPMVKENRDCLSAVTQKKGVLSEEEQCYIKTYGFAWGCDLCQLACPSNQAVLKNGIETPIDFFHQNRIQNLTADVLDAMSDEEFKRRAFSWRGKALLYRNLEILSR